MSFRIPIWAKSTNPDFFELQAAVNRNTLSLTVKSQCVYAYWPTFLLDFFRVRDTFWYRVAMKKTVAVRGIDAIWNKHFVAILLRFRLARWVCDPGARLRKCVTCRPLAVAVEGCSKIAFLSLDYGDSLIFFYKFKIFKFGVHRFPGNPEKKFFFSTTLAADEQNSDWILADIADFHKLGLDSDFTLADGGYFRILLHTSLENWSCHKS